MTEWRIADIVGQAGGGYDGVQLMAIEGSGCGVSIGEVLIRNGIAYGLAQRAAYRGDLKRMGEAIVHEDRAGQGKHLCLILQSAKGGGEYDAVVVADVGSAGGVGVGVLAGTIAGALRAEEALPVHDLAYSS